MKSDPDIETEIVLIPLKCALQTTVTHEDRLSVTGYKFYCTVRANHFVNLGTWYYEAKVVDIPEGGATRIGWAQRFANLQAPLGFDKFGYSMRSRKGTRFHQGFQATELSTFTLKTSIQFWSWDI